MNSEQCDALVGWGSQCQNKAKVTRGGKGYCGVHDPDLGAKKRADREAKWAARNHMNDMRLAEAKALAVRIGAGVPSYTNGYTGGLVLTAEEARALADELDKRRGS